MRWKLWVCCFFSFPSRRPLFMPTAELPVPLRSALARCSPRFHRSPRNEAWMLRNNSRPKRHSRGEQCPTRELHSNRPTAPARRRSRTASGAAGRPACGAGPSCCGGWPSSSRPAGAALPRAAGRAETGPPALPGTAPGRSPPRPRSERAGGRGSGRGAGGRLAKTPKHGNLL